MNTGTKMTLRELKAYIEGPCVVTMVGMSGSGKSTLAYELADSEDEVLSSDEFRQVLTGDPTNQQVTSKAFQMIYDICKSRSSWRQRSFIDATNLQRRDRKAYYGPVTKGLPTYAIIVKADPDECKRRQGLRDRQVPDFVVDKHAQRFASVHQTLLDETEKWSGVFEYDTETGEVTVLR